MVHLEALAPRVEQYSIDKMFLDVRGIDSCIDFEGFDQQLREHVRNGTGLTIGVGMGPTKTLAKSTQWSSKEWPQFGGVLALATVWWRAGINAGQYPPCGKTAVTAAGGGNLGCGPQDLKEAEHNRDNYCTAAGARTLYLSGRTSMWFWRERSGNSMEKAVFHWRKNRPPNSR